MTAIETVLWPGLAKLAPGSKLGGILARKPGYHNSRDHLPATDYSVAQFAIDREGPASEASAIDWTFPDAQAGDYRTIARFSQLLLAAGRAGDRRAYPLREFFGNADSDTDVEGWDFAKDRASSSDRSHLWHIHMSIHRKYLDDPAAMNAVLSILAREPAPTIPKPAPVPAPTTTPTEKIVTSLPTLNRGDRGLPVRRTQALLNVAGVRVSEDSDFGPATALAVKAFQRARSITADAVVGPRTWAKLLGV